MADITITVTANEDDLRGLVASKLTPFGPVGRIANAIAAALPKPRIAVKPGMVLRRRSDGMRFVGIEVSGRIVCLRSVVWDVCDAPFPLDGLDPDEWEVLLDG